MNATAVAADDAAVALHVHSMLGPREGRNRRLARPAPAACTPWAGACLCSDGCPTGWRGCKRSFLCGNQSAGPLARAEEPAAGLRVAILVYLTFSVAEVRKKFAGEKAWKACMPLPALNGPWHSLCATPSTPC